jgi:hypothetical protein
VRQAQQAQLLVLPVHKVLLDQQVQQVRQEQASQFLVSTLTSLHCKQHIQQEILVMAT